jgi:hypothetical protein
LSETAAHFNLKLDAPKKWLAAKLQSWPWLTRVPPIEAKLPATFSSLLLAWRRSLALRAFAFILASYHNARYTDLDYECLSREFASLISVE